MHHNFYESFHNMGCNLICETVLCAEVYVIPRAFHVGIKIQRPSWTALYHLSIARVIWHNLDLDTQNGHRTTKRCCAFRSGRTLCLVLWLELSSTRAYRRIALTMCYVMMKYSFDSLGALATRPSMVRSEYGRHQIQDNERKFTCNLLATQGYFQQKKLYEFEHFVQLGKIWPRLENVSMLWFVHAIIYCIRYCLNLT